MTSLPESDSRDQNEDSRKQMDHDADEDRNTVEETERAGEDGQHSDEAGRGSSSTATSVFQNFTVLRDFFFAAFSDGYNATFCGVDDVTNCCKGSKVSPYDNHSIKATKSGGSFDSASVQHSASQAEGTKRRRKKPLAVAVGFNYTRDADGRPIIITPTGSRNSPIDLTNARVSPPGRASGPAPSLPTLNAQTPASFTPGVPTLRPSQSRHYAPSNALSY